MPELITDMSEPVNSVTMKVARERTIVWLIPTIPIPEWAQKNTP